jgi:hypothetical protein
VRYNPQDHEPMGSFELIEPGLYRAIIIDTAWKQNAAKTGHYLKLQFEITDASAQGRYLWVNLNLDHPNDMAVSIANRELRSLCDAIGRQEPLDITEAEPALGLLHKRLVIRVAVEKRKDTGELQNVVKGYEGLEDGAAQPTTAKFTPQGDDDLPF